MMETQKRTTMEVWPRARAGGGHTCVVAGIPPAMKKLRIQKKRARSQDSLEVEGVARPTSRWRKQVVGVCPADIEAAAARVALQNLQAIVISLERRPDRMTGCSLRLNARAVGLPFTCFPATDGRAGHISESEVSMSWNTARNVVYQKIRAVRKGWNDLDTYKERTLDMSPGERGCASSHIRAWRHCLERCGSTNQPLLVLEDDAAPTADFLVTLHRALQAVPADAGLLYLGYSQAAGWRREVSPELVEAEYVWTTVAYLVWPTCARVLLSKLPVNEPVDNWLAGLSAECNLKAYCVRPKIVLQADAWNINSDVAHSDEHYWGPNSDIHHSDHLYWGPQVEPPVGGTCPGLGVLEGSCFWGAESDDSEEESL